MVESAESFGKYTLIEKVAAGGMAEIFKAKTVGIGGFEKLLAIKRLHPQFSEENEVAQMLVDEARIAVHLTHPNIAQTFDLGCIDDQYFIAMEFIEGVDLHQVNKISRERGSSVPTSALVFIMAEALGGLHYAHTRTGADGSPLNIVHRDVSPQNVMISYEGEVKLVDFGIAKAEMRAQQDTQHGIIKGKFYYMAPEQAHGHHVDQRTDIFAAGMVLYELLAGRNPYARIEEYELLKAVRKADFPPLSSVRPDVDPRLDEIVTRATRRDANYRYDSAREMRVALMDYLDATGSGTYRRMELADFIRSLEHRQGYEGMVPEDSARMSRQDFEATEASMIFEPGSISSDKNETLGGPEETEEGAENPFGAEEPTQLWSRDEIDGAPAQQADHPSELSSPQFVDPRGFGNAVPPKPKVATSRTKLPFLDRIDFDRLLPDNIEHPKAILLGLGTLVLLLGGVLAYLISGGDEPADPPEEAPAQIATAEPTAAPEPQQKETRVDLRLSSTPPGATVHLDGKGLGETPLVLEQLSVEESYELMLSKPGHATLEATIEPSEDDEELEFELEGGDAVLKVSTYPPDARVEVDGEIIGRSPVGVGGLSRESTHEVVARFDDGRKLRRQVRWEDGDERVKEVELLFGEGGEAEDAEQAIAEKTPTAKKKTRAPRRRKRQRRSASKVSPKLDLFGNSDTKGQGKLDVRIRGKGKVYVDNKLVSGNTDRHTQSLAPGTYEVKVYFSRLKRHSRAKTVEVAAGETSKAHFAP